MVVHNMGSSCPGCTLWADGYNGVHHHVVTRTGYVVSSPRVSRRPAEICREPRLEISHGESHGHELCCRYGLSLRRRPVATRRLGLQACGIEAPSCIRCGVEPGR